MVIEDYNVGVNPSSKDKPYIICWCKWISSYTHIWLRKRSLKTRFDWYDMAVEHDPYKVAFLPPPEEINLESPLTESQLLQVRNNC
ncbi:hypothetical protein TNIN_297021 [Trichonephila inaurata madagascariensis]|uniref:Uncharacterized protein n=1 Tax=Trichonephila inaurata madagascariensis TaxID=2747483 RepID=A0A8X6Y4Y7_9ARAC|nr:hypothetical protein TNIN_297021 [Trichonephila inaurata madagascariensis]